MKKLVLATVMIVMALIGGMAANYFVEMLRMIGG